MSLPPISPAAASLRTQIIGSAEELLSTGLDAAAAAEAATHDLTPPTTPAAPAPPSPLAQAVEVARASAATRQASLAPLFANLTQALASPALPAPIRALIAQVLALQTPANEPVTAQTIQQAVAQSGLFLEAHLAAQAPQGEATPPDLKAALLNLQRALSTLAEAPPRPEPRGAIPAPPVRQAALAAQPAATPTLPANAETPVIAQHLRAQIDQAVARQSLHQMASLPDGRSSSWLVELPIATPQGTTISQLEVQRDGKRSSEDAESAETWRVRFSIDVDPLGPVHVHLRMVGDKAAVTVWAERDASLAVLQSQGAELARALPAEVIFHPGSPHRPTPAPGQFVDRSS